MAISNRTIDIGEYTYTVTQLDAVAGRKTFVRLANLLGPAMAKVTTPEAALGALFSNLREEDLDHFCELFGKLTCVTGGEYEDKSPVLVKQNFMGHFAGNYLDMFEWLVFCVVANFSSFFTGIEALVKKYAPQTPAAPQSEAAKS